MWLVEQHTGTCFPTCVWPSSEPFRALLLLCGCRAGEVRGIMEQNRQMLAERGERLQRLDERTAAMADDADDFASMAKQLADMQANRKWWQL